MNQLSQKTWCEVAAKFKPKSRYKNQEVTKCSTLKEKHAPFLLENRQALRPIYTLFSTFPAILTSYPQLLKHPQLTELLKDSAILIQVSYGFRFISIIFEIYKFNLLLSVILDKY